MTASDDHMLETLEKRLGRLHARQRLGIEKVRKDTVYACETVRAGLLDRLKKSKARARDAWLEGRVPKHPTQFIPLTPIETVSV